MGTVERLQKAAVRVNRLNKRLGRPNYKLVVLEYPEDTYSSLGDAILVQSLDERQTSQYRQSNVEVSINDLRLTCVPRYLSLEALQQGRYVIGATSVGGGWAGVVAKAVHVDVNSDLFYSVLVRVFRQR